MASTAPILPDESGLDALPSRLRQSIEPYVDRLDVDIQELLRSNRGLIIDSPEYGADVYNALRAGTLDPTQVTLNEEMVFTVPNTSLFSAVIEDMFQQHKK